MNLIKLALKEDTPKGDITTNLFIPKDKIISAEIMVKENGIICGLDMAKMVFQQLDKKIIFKKNVKEGQRVKNRQVVAELKGKARAILTGERTALNFMQHLSGIATLTRKYVEIVRGPMSLPRQCLVAGDVQCPKIYDTRKTTPLLRELEKYAVRCGGGYNHRLNLSDMVLIKDNHLEMAEDLPAGKAGLEFKVKKLKKENPKIKIEIEAQNIRQVEIFVKLKPDIIMLDNMNYREMKKAIKYIHENSNSEIEISGNVSIKTIKKIVSLKPDRISIGKITHSAPSLDICLEIAK
ncbi:MAG: carboxylating nicotinate-nucleotide diphosphorylase [Elusimicrobia bacterium]|nr:carboxylating nicotinate-nucleotide diphosphorylase [Elusimicrobiota bacterium]